MSSPLISGGKNRLANPSPISSSPPQTLKSEVFGTSSSLPPLVSEGGELVCESVGKAGLLSDHFDSKQSGEAVITSY